MAKLKYSTDKDIQNGYLHNPSEYAAGDAVQEQKSWKSWILSDPTNNLIKQAPIERP